MALLQRISCAVVMHAVLSAMFAERAAADDAATPELGETITVTSQRTPELRRLLDGYMVTLVNAATRLGELATVADLLTTVPGVRVRQLGGVGSLAQLSVRGAAPGHTQVFIDDVPVSRLAAVSVDVGQFLADSIGELELYRGAVPLTYAGGGVGGVLQLHSRLSTQPGSRVALGAGSFGTTTAHVWQGLAGPSLRASVAVDWLHSEGNFVVFGNGGTPLNPADDAWVARRNNGVRQASVVARVAAPLTATRPWQLGVRLSQRAQGLAGPLANPSLRTRLASLGVAADGRVAHRLRGWTLTHTSYGAWGDEAYADPANELGLAAQQRTYHTASVGWQSLLSRGWAQRRVAGVTALVRLDGDRYQAVDDLAAVRSADGGRWALALATGVDLRLGAWELAPGLRLDGVRTRPPAELDAPGRSVVPPRVELAVTPRLTVRRPLAAALIGKGSLGRYVRLPTLNELFGDRGYVVGNPELHQEQGYAADLGVVWTAQPWRVATQLEAGVFVHRNTDAIGMVNQGLVAKALNLGETRAAGAELAVSARHALGTLEAHGMLLHTRQDGVAPSYDGKAVPRMPWGSGYARLTPRWPRYGHRMFVEIDVATRSYTDRGNLNEVPARTLFHGGVALRLGARVSLHATVRNLGNVRTQQVAAPGGRAMTVALADLAGFPLPGRAYFLQLELQSQKDEP